MDDQDLKDLFAPYRTGPRAGFADRVMHRLRGTPDLPARRRLLWFGFGAELAGAAAALWLFVSAMNMPEPIWFSQDQVVPQITRTAWVNTDVSAYPDWMEE